MSRRPSDRSDGYVGQADWLVLPGRTDLVDLVADEFERPEARAAETDSPDHADRHLVAS
ncbi:MAG TPA: hypothetical protein VHI14_09215 [Jatrophihabitantaceae bacterium]|jgi:hypothetical protein|nr:hypothetical protein [Jatrophihabitantaceae bacterium]